MTEGEAVTQLTETTQSRREAQGLSFTAASLPPSCRYPTRAALTDSLCLQFIRDWKVASDKAALVREGPVYDGDDPKLLPSIAVVVHALADRAGVPVPDWVAGHRAPEDVMMFRWEFDGRYARWERRRSPAVCAYHRVWFHPRMLDKGTPDWWLPWD